MRRYRGAMTTITRNFMGTIVLRPTWKHEPGRGQRPGEVYTSTVRSEPLVIAPEDRTLAALTHLSGLAGYVLPLGGVLVPVIIWGVRSESPVISSLAKQALLLNLIVFLLFATTLVLWLTIILIPFVILFWIGLGVAAIALPIIGAIKANQGLYFEYPVVGITPVRSPVP